MSIVGDAYARPLVEELRRGPYDLPALRMIGTGGAATSDEHKEALLELIAATSRSSTATARRRPAAWPTARAPGRPALAGFAPGAGATVALGRPQPRPRAAATTRSAGPPVAAACRSATSAIRERTEATFPIIDGERFAVPGDRATVAADGTIRMLGRDSMVVNTGGEKVFVEEVEEALLRHPAVVDVLVVGRPSERFGQEVVAIVQPRGGDDASSPSELREFAATSIARFKAPRAVASCDAVGRHANGKADYRWAQDGGRRRRRSTGAD